MSSRPLLTGHQEYVDDRDERIRHLEMQNRQLDEALRLERNKTGQYEFSLRELRKMTLPFLNLLQAVHGQPDTMGINGESTTASNARWDSVKQRMPGKPAEFIDLLIAHGSMNVTNFITLARCSKQTAYNILSKLGQSGIVQNNGGKYSLKGE